MTSNFYTRIQLMEMGFATLGKNVRISRKTSIYGAERIHIGDNSRIDDFAILSAGEGGIFIGKYVHISCHCSVIGQGKIILDDYSGISGRVSIYSSSDSYDGMYMTNPTLPPHVMNTTHAPVTLGKHTVVGAGSVILPGVTLHPGCAVYAMSLVTPGSFGACSIIAGVPAKGIKKRETRIFELEKEL